MMLEENVPDQGGKYMSFTKLKGVDISGANGDVDFEMLKRNGISFVMINLGNLFADNVKKAEAAGMPWGAYYYTYSLSAEEDKQELDKILGRLSGKKPTYPVAIDVEDGDEYKIDHGGWNYENVNRNTKYLLEGIRKAGYYPMLYTGSDEIENYIDKSVWQNVDMWWAQWNSKCSYSYDNLGMWQFGGEVNYICSRYIEGKVFDQNYVYKDYPTIIKNGGWNNWGTPTPTPSPKKKPIEMLAFEVLDGYWGSGDERKKLLTEAGYDYQAVQNRVNEICASWSKPTLDEKGYKLGESNIAILAIKEMINFARKLGIIDQGVSDNKVYGDGTLIAVNLILKIGNYNQNGIMGENFVKCLSKLIKNKMNK